MCVGLECYAITSCNKTNSNFHLDYELKNQFNDWYNSLTNSPWNKDDNNNFINYYCNSEQQAIGLYSWNGGTFWNEPLHQQKIPQNVTLTLRNLDKNTPHEIRGDDYKLVDSALNKAIYPRNDILYHGVEYQEIEYWDQLKNLITQNSDGSYDYTKCIGQTIISYGWISTSLDKDYALGFAENWRPSYNDEWPSQIIENNPLKERVMFEIHIKKNYNGAAYLANFDFADFGDGSTENQVMIKRNCKFKINKIYKENNTNIFVVDLIE